MTRSPSDRAERTLSGMDAPARTPSTFDYDEAKFQFHTGNEIPAAAECAIQAFRDVGTERRDPVIDNRARQVLNRVPSTATALPAVRELREIVHSPVAHKS